MKTVKDTTFENIDESTPEGKLLKTAVAMICFLRFPAEKPNDVLEVVKDVNMDIFRSEALSTTMEKVKARKKS